jgi:hypothetical protein
VSWELDGTGTHTIKLAEKQRIIPTDVADIRVIQISVSDTGTERGISSGLNPNYYSTGTVQIDKSSRYINKNLPK